MLSLVFLKVKEKRKQLQTLRSSLQSLMRIDGENMYEKALNTDKKFLTSFQEATGFKSKDEFEVSPFLRKPVRCDANTS